MQQAVRSEGALTPEKKAKVTAMLYRAFKASGKVDEALIAEGCRSCSELTRSRTFDTGAKAGALKRNSHWRPTPTSGRRTQRWCKRVRRFLDENFHWHDRLAKSGSDLEVVEILFAMVSGGSIVVIPETRRAVGRQAGTLQGRRNRIARCRGDGDGPHGSVA